jgi:predicted PolB exonuclease-like 3'-5' exonuclease
VTKKVVMDIETILDAEAVARARFQPGETFAPFPLHQLACVSLLVVEQDAMARPLYSIHSFSREQHSERGIIASVERVLSDSFEVITSNGRGFDVPVLMTRVALTGEYAPTIARLCAENRRTPGLHVDLLDVVSGYGAAPKVSLNQLCAAFSIPCKLHVGGADVASLVAAGAWRKLSHYCETDVIATYLAAQMWRGAERGTAELTAESCTRLAHWINASQPELEHLLPYAVPPVMPGGGSALGDIDYREMGW